MVSQVNFTKKVIFLRNSQKKKYSSEQLLLELKVYFLIKLFIIVTLIIMDVAMIIIITKQCFIKY